MSIKVKFNEDQRDYLARNFEKLATNYPAVDVKHIRYSSLAKDLRSDKALITLDANRCAAILALTEAAASYLDKVTIPEYIKRNELSYKKRAEEHLRLIRSIITLIEKKIKAD